MWVGVRLHVSSKHTTQYAGTAGNVHGERSVICVNVVSHAKALASKWFCDSSCMFRRTDRHPCTWSPAQAVLAVPPHLPEVLQDFGWNSLQDAYPCALPTSVQKICWSTRMWSRLQTTVRLLPYSALLGFRGSGAGVLIKAS